VRALLIDLDDTLLDYSGGARECWAGACAAAAAHLDQPALLAAIHESARWFWSDAGRHRRERVDMMAAWSKIAALGLERCGVAVDGLAGKIAQDFAARRFAAMRLFSDALPLLEAMRARNVPMALLTNGDVRMQREKIARWDLARFFEVIVIEGEFGAGKPDPEVFHHALTALGVPAADAWMVGDSLLWDMTGARRVGAHAVWLDRAGEGLPPASPVRPDRIIHSLDDLH
jgi:putative hydrolase of the HAD superfamily